MGGRGSSSGISDNGKKYGTEYQTVAQFGNVKVIQYNGNSVTAPMETMTRGRIYATLDHDNDIKYITFYDSVGERSKQIDVKGRKHNGQLPHTHEGYLHDEYGTHLPTKKEQQQIERIIADWNRRRKKLGL